MPVDAVVVGGLRLDYLITTEGEVRVRQLGGNAVYAGVGARIWTDQVGLLSRVGENYPRELLSTLAAHGLHTEGVVTLPGEHEIYTFYAYRPDGRRVDTDPAAHFARVGHPLPPELTGYEHSTPGQGDLDYHPLGTRLDDFPSAYDSAQVVHIAPCQLRTHIDLPPYLKQRGVSLLTLDPGERDMRPYLADHILGLLQDVDVYLPSEQEVCTFFGPDVELEEAAARFAQAGPEVVAIKVGKRGVLVYERSSGRCTPVPPYPTPVVDVTGAGDAFCGGFAVGYWRTGNPLRAACMGNVSASLVIEGYGGLHALIRRAEAPRRLKQMEEL